jgi:hypothetical protein
MKPKRAVNVYRNHEFIGHFNSINEASDQTKENATTIRNILEGKQEISRRGYVYTDEPLTEEEMQSMPTQKETKQKKRFNNDCKQIIGNYDYEVPCANHQVTYQARSKEQRIKDFKFFLYKKLDMHWQMIPKAAVNLEKVFINDFLDSI